MAKKKKPYRCPETGNPDWVDWSEFQIHPDHRVGDGWDILPPVEGDDPYHGESWASKAYN